MKKIFIFGVIVIFIGIVILFFRLTNDTHKSLPENVSQPTTITKVNEVSSPLTPESSSVKDPWDVWIHEQADIMAKILESESDGVWTYDEAYEAMVTQLTKMAAEQKKVTDIPPPLDLNPTMKSDVVVTNWKGQEHHGPQTLEAITETFGDYGSSAADEMYPPDQWLQRILDKGVPIEDTRDFTGYLAMRGTLFFIAEQSPEMQDRLAKGSGYPTDSWEAFEDAYINHNILLHQQFTRAQDADNTITGGMFIGDNFYPTHIDKNTVYVKGRETGATFFGSELTLEEEFNIIFRGIEPEGYDIVYLDDDGKQMLEKPEPITQEEFLNAHLDKWLENEDGLLGSAWVPPMLALPEELDFLSEDATEEDFTEFVDNRSRMQGEAAKEKYEQAREEIMKYARMTDMELKEEFNKLIMSEVDNIVISKMSQENTPEQLETLLIEAFSRKSFQEAMSLLDQYGLESGIQRIRETNPSLAEYLSQSIQQKQRSLKVPPKPPLPSQRK